jgi:hypothetical protein
MDVMHLVINYLAQQFKYGLSPSMSNKNAMILTTTTTAAVPAH